MILKTFAKIYLDVALLEVVVVYLHTNVHEQAVGVDDEVRLPFSAPEIIEVEVDASDLNAELLVLIKENI